MLLPKGHGAMQYDCLDREWDAFLPSSCSPGSLVQLPFDFSEDSTVNPELGVRSGL